MQDKSIYCLQRIVTLKLEESSSLDTAHQPIHVDRIAVNNTQKENINSDDDPLKAEL
jgi:hypothetical protein